MIFLLRGLDLSNREGFVDRYLFEPAEAVISDRYLNKHLFQTPFLNPSNFGEINKIRDTILEIRVQNRVHHTVLDGENITKKRCQSVIEMGKRYMTPVIMISIDPPPLEHVLIMNNGVYPVDEVESKHKRYFNKLDHFYTEDLYNPFFRLIRLDPDYEVVYQNENS